MYEYISGRLSSITPANAVVDCCGVGYLLEITLNTYSAIQESSEVKLWVHEVIREDAHLLYGFFSTQERTMFRLLLGVNGVGAKTAQRIVLELQDKVGDTAMGAGLPQASAAMVGAASVKKEEAVSALVMLGFPKTAAEKVVMALDNSMTVEEMIKEGLRRI